MTSGAQKAPSFVWQAAGKPFEAHLSLDVVDRLAFAVAEGVQALPRRGLEIGGLLLGRVHQGPAGVVVQIEEFEAVECAHATGPSYLLNEKDRAAIEERIRAHKTAGLVDVVGAFRSHTRKEFALAAEDLELMSAYFPARSDVFLLIQGLRDSPLTAAFAIREDSQIPSLAPGVPFPFRRDSLEAGGHRLGAVAAPHAAIAAQRPEAPIAAPRSPHAPAPTQTMAAAAPAPTPVEAAVAEASPRAIVLVIRLPHLPSLAWMRGALQSKWLTAGCAILVLALAAVWHRTSSGPALAPQPMQRTFSARALTANAVPAPSLPDTPQTQPDIVEHQQQANPPAATAAPRRDNAGRGVETREIRARARKMSPPSATLDVRPVGRSTPLPEPPVASPQLAINDKTAALYPDFALKTIPKLAPPFVKVTIESESPDRGEFFDMPKRKNAEDADFIPPKILHAAATDVPENLRELVKDQIPIDVRVYINAAGKVEFAELTSGASGLKKQLGAIAVFASRRWVFKPAMSGGENVPADVVLRYRFGAQ